MNTKASKQAQTVKRVAVELVVPDLEDEIAQKYFFSALQGAMATYETVYSDGIADPLRSITFCVLLMKNGFPIVGQSQCMAPDDYNAYKGTHLAELDAYRKARTYMDFLHHQDKFDLPMLLKAMSPSFIK